MKKKVGAHGDLTDKRDIKFLTRVYYKRNAKKEPAEIETLVQDDQADDAKGQV
jgi:hypothetical protein